MGKAIIATDRAPKAIGPYSQAVKTGNLVFTSGQLPLDPVSGELVTGDIKRAAQLCLENIKAILEAAGSSMDNVIKTTIFLKDMNDFAAVNEVYGAYFKEKQPARSCVQVARLPKDADVEMEAIAAVEQL